MPETFDEPSTENSKSNFENVWDKCFGATGCVKPKMQPRMSGEMKEIIESFNKNHLIKYDSRAACDEDSWEKESRAGMKTSINNKCPENSSYSFSKEKQVVWSKVVKKKVLQPQFVIGKFQESVKERKLREEAIERERMKNQLLKEFCLKKVSKTTEHLLLRRSGLEQTIRKIPRGVMHDDILKEVTGENLLSS